MNPDALNNPETLVDPLGLDPSDCRVNASGSVTCYGPDSTTVYGGAGGNCQMVTSGYVYCPGSSGGYWAMWGWNANCVTLGGCGSRSQSGVAGPAGSPPAAKPPAPPPIFRIRAAPPPIKPVADNRPSCLSVLLNGLGGDASPTGEVVEQGAKTASGAVAQLTAVYVAAKGLTVPLRSPYVRLLTNVSELLGVISEAAPAAFLTYEVVSAEIPAIKAKLTGQCQNNFWSIVPSMPVLP
jgi:hypothetical protein